jgi:hypothetical protein
MVKQSRVELVGGPYCGKSSPSVPREVMLRVHLTGAYRRTGKEWPDNTVEFRWESHDQYDESSNLEA